ncbi:MAG TPA: protein-glutamate O-methyltransferase CheR [Bryocella sp.]|nr:protein-glutamate O-methyltransferase CheR [Bryocella sp.]
MSLGVPDFEYLRDFVRSHTAIVLDSGKEYLAEARLTPLLREAGCSSLPELLALLRGQQFGGLHRKVLDAMTNNETWFFRDVNPFTALSKLVIPNLLERRAADQSISIWSAGCSTGQEPFSIAMLIRENFHLSNWTFSILATDFSRTALERAQSGLYRQLEVNRGLPANLLAGYFHREGLCWRLRPDIMAMVTFSLLNLAEPWGAAVPAIDIVFLRNVLIYFDISTRKAILERVRRVLRPDGYLFLGGAETTLNIDRNFQRTQSGNIVYYTVKDN